MSEPTLTRTEQVLQVLRDGGHIEVAGERGLLRLVDHRGTEVPAWQNAMKSARKLWAAGS
ncbi:MAG: hypothetical protein AB1832_00990 [Pseudomonadota bacterium]